MKKLYICLLAVCLLFCRASAEQNDLKSWAVSGLTEVLGYTAEEAVQFTFEAQPDGSLRYWPADHPQWIYTTFYDQSQGGVRGSTPFETDFVRRSGEGIFRDILRTAREEGWLANWNEESKAALIDFCLEDVSRLSSTLRFAETAAQAIQGIFESCYGPEPHWPAALAGYRDELLDEYGLTMEKAPFHITGVRRQTGRNLPAVSLLTLTVFDGEAPEELAPVFANPQLDGWTLQSGAAGYQDWGDLHVPSGAGLAAFEKDGRRQLIQLALMDGQWKIYPLGENALYQAGDYRVTYDGLHGSFAIQYLLDENEICSFYVTPSANSAHGYDQVFCRLDAYERVNAATGDALWLDAYDSGVSTWESQWIGPGMRCPQFRFPRFLGMLPMESFSTDPENQVNWLPEGVLMTSGVNFRSKTSSRSKAYGELLPGVLLPALGTVPGDPADWIHTRLGFYEGYVSSWYTFDSAREMNATQPQPVAQARRETRLKRGAGLLDGTMGTLPAGTKMHVVMEDGGWLYVSIPRDQTNWLMDVDGAFGYVKKSDVRRASMLCQLDWME